MTLRQLEIIYAILRTGSITAAAQSLHVSQPAVSNVLTHTEQKLRMKLFERIKGRLVPTPEVLTLVPELESIFGRVETVQRLVENFREGRSGHIALATSPTLVNSLLPETLAKFKRLNPLVRLSIQSLPTEQVTLRVARREVDFGVAYGPVDDPAVEVQRLVQARIVCAVHQDHKLASFPVIRPEDLQQESVISTGLRSLLGSLIERRCLEEGCIVPPNSIEASSSLFACHLASCGAGVALVDSTTRFGIYPPNLVFKPFAPKITLNINLVFPLERPRSRASTALTNLLLAHYDELGRTGDLASEAAPSL